MTGTTLRPLPGGPLAIDLVNTVWHEGSNVIDWLVDDEAVTAFLAEWDKSIPADSVTQTRVALVEARELIRTLLEHAANGASDADKLVTKLNAALAAARTEVTATDGGATMTITGDQPTNALAIEAIVNAVELWQERSNRVRSCEHEDCVLWFLDTSKSGRRRWCSMETCGNRIKAKRHYERSKHATS